MSIKVIIVEDIKDVREGLKFFLQLDSQISVIKTFEAGEDLLEYLEHGTKPDIILMDIVLPKINGIETTGIVTKTYPDIKVLILTIFEDDEKILRSIKAGAKGYVLKNTKPDQLIEQVKTLYNGGSPISPKIARTIIDEIHSKSEIAQKKDYNLTPREKQILEDIVEGYTYKEVATKYNIANSTAKKHILHIYQKLNVSSKVEIIKKVIKEGLI